MAANKDGEIVLVLDEEFLQAPRMLAAVMFPDRSGWHTDIPLLLHRIESGIFDPGLQMWSQRARCATCDRIFVVHEPISQQTPDDALLDILARFGDGEWENVAYKHHRECGGDVVYDDLSA